MIYRSAGRGDLLPLLQARAGCRHLLSHREDGIKSSLHGGHRLHADHDLERAEADPPHSRDGAVYFTRLGHRRGAGLPHREAEKRDGNPRPVRPSGVPWFTLAPDRFVAPPYPASPLHLPPAPMTSDTRWRILCFGSNGWAESDWDITDYG